MISLNQQQHSAVLNLFFETDKPRNPVGVTPFGNIIYSEINGKKETVYYSIRFISFKFADDFKAYISYFASQKEFEQYERDPNLFYKFHNSYLGGNTVEFVQKQLGALGKEELYFVEANYSSNPEPLKHIHKLSLTEFLSIIEKHYTANPPDYSALFEYTYKTEKHKVLTAYQEHTFDFINAKNYAHWGNREPKTSTFHNTWFTEDVALMKDLSYLSIKNNASLPKAGLDAISKLYYLVELELTDNRLSELPNGLETLGYLNRLTLDHNEFTSVSAVLGLQKLKKLSMVNNLITQIPEEIAHLKHLTRLDLSGNKITELPSVLLEMKHLRVLNLSKNPLKKLPEWIGELDFLEELHLTQTQLETLPLGIVKLTKLKVIGLKKNPFISLPQEMLSMDKKALDIEERNRALFDVKLKAKLAKLPTGNISKFEDFNFKLMVIQHLMYNDEVLLPKFDVYEFVENYKQRDIDLSEISYEIIPEVKAYFEQLEIPLPLLWDIKRLEACGGDEIYHQLIPHWDGEDDAFMVKSANDTVHLPNLKQITLLCNNKEVTKELRAQKIKVSTN